MVICLEQGTNDFACGPAHATATPSHLVSWWQLTQIVLEKMSFLCSLALDWFGRNLMQLTAGNGCT